MATDSNPVLISSTNQSDNVPNNSSLITAGILFGLGLGGFFDGIVLHEILQWHHMLTGIGYPDTTVAGLKINTLADGFFHLGTYILTVGGLVVLSLALERGKLSWSSRIFGGALLMGAGIFNLVEGVIDHHLLGIHHVKPGPNELAWDLGFLAVGALLAFIGWLLLGAGRRNLILK